MANVDPSKHTRFRNSFRNMGDDISKGLSTSRDASVDGNWAKWAAFCKDVYLDPLLIS